MGLSMINFEGWFEMTNLVLEILIIIPNVVLSIDNPSLETFNGW